MQLPVKDSLSLSVSFTGTSVFDLTLVLMDSTKSLLFDFNSSGLVTHTPVEAAVMA